MRKTILATLMLCSVAVINFYSCKEEEEVDTDTQAAEEDAAAETIFNDIFYQVGNSTKEDTTINKTMTNNADSICGTVTVKDTNGNMPPVIFPVIVTIDYGDSNILCYDGHTRKGKIKAVFNGRYRDSGTVITITLIDYYMDSNSIQGTKTITNNGRNISGNLSFTISVTGASINTSAAAYSWQSTRTREWIQGESTPFYLCDDEYKITGSATGTDRNGQSYSITITDALTRKICCRWIVSGKLEIAVANKVKRSLDFGSGACDHYAKVTINSQSHDIILP